MSDAPNRSAPSNYSRDVPPENISTHRCVFVVYLIVYLMQTRIAILTRNALFH